MAEKEKAQSWRSMPAENRDAAMAELRERLAEYHRRTATSRSHAQFLSGVLIALNALYATLLVQTRLNKWLLGLALGIAIMALLQTLWSARPQTKYGWRIRRQPPWLYRVRPAADSAQRALRNTPEERFYILSRKVDALRIGTWERYHRQWRITIFAGMSVISAAASALVAAWPHIAEAL